jgi:phosphatidylglycerol:prolipoprotein diacylglycerol transferase
MWPTVFEIPWFHLPIRGYGLMLMIGFLGGTWWAAKRAVRVKADPDLVINLGFAALIASVIGARAFYVIHYWDEHFAGRGLRAVIDITAGGMEFYGGFLGAFAAVLGYLAIKKAPFRLYLDIIAPSLMFGMGMARIGCFLNGCCWGAVCPPEIPWSVRFPYASPAAYRQWEERVITYPAELITTYYTGSASLINRDDLNFGPERRKGPEYAYRQAVEALEQARIRQADSATIDKLRKRVDATRKKVQESSSEYATVARQEWQYMLTPSEVQTAADEGRTHAVHPVQLYASINGLLLAVLLNNLFYRRKQHGLVTAVLFLTYPLMRIMEEIIRSDNPHDVIGMTISQFVSVAILVGGIVYLIAIYRLPANSMPAPARAGTRGSKRELAKKK